MKTIAAQKRTSIQNVRMLALSAVLSAISFVSAFFELFMPLDQLIASFGQFIPFIRTKLDVVLFSAFPFSLLKGIGISLATIPLYKRLAPILKGRQK